MEGLSFRILRYLFQTTKLWKELIVLNRERKSAFLGGFKYTRFSIRFVKMKNVN